MDENHSSATSHDAGHPIISPAGEASLSRGWTVLRRRWPWLVSSALVVCGLSLLLSLHQTKLYSASTQVYLSQQNLADALSGIASTTPYDTATAQRLAATQAAIADTRPVATEAIGAVKAAHLSPKELLAESHISPNANADILNFAVTDHDPRLAVLLVNAVASAYISYRLRIDTGAIALARHKLDAYLAELTKKGQSNSSLYSGLISKSAELQSLQALDTANSTIIEPAVSASQVAPRITRNAVLGFLLGVLMGIGFMLARETVDTRLRSEDDVASELDLPLLGRVGPPPRHLRGQRARAAMLADPHHASAEACRLLRANLDLSLLHSKVLLVASAGDGEGKSTMTANLAVAWARIGVRVLVLDLDLRQPRQASLLGSESGYGITDVLRGTADLRSAIQRVSLGQQAESGTGISGGRLFCLSPGPAPSNIGELLALREFGSLVAQLRGAPQFDLILIDSPPAVKFSDAASLARVSDALLIVARVGLLHRSAARELQRITAQWDLRRLGFVLTGSQGAASADRYRYGYHRSTGEVSSLSPGTHRVATAPAETGPYSSLGQQ